MSQYRGVWKRKVYCLRCKEWKHTTAKKGEVCEDCNANNRKGLNLLKTEKLRQFRLKYELPPTTSISFNLLLKGKLPIHDHYGFVSRSKVEELNKNKEELINFGKELLEIENNWRRSKHLKPLKVFPHGKSKFTGISKLNIKEE